MLLPYRQFIAVLLAIWLPVFSGNALAASLSMQMPAAHCQDEAMQMESAMDMEDMADMGAHHSSAAPGEHQPSCQSCGVCHLACTGYFAVHSELAVAAQAGGRDITPYLVAFNSHTSAPLLPPPLVLA